MEDVSFSNALMQHLHWSYVNIVQDRWVPSLNQSFLCWALAVFGSLSSHVSASTDADFFSYWGLTCLTYPESEFHCWICAEPLLSHTNYVACKCYCWIRISLLTTQWQAFSTGDHYLNWYRGWVPVLALMNTFFLILMSGIVQHILLPVSAIIESEFFMLSLCCLLHRAVQIQIQYIFCCIVL